MAHDMIWTVIDAMVVKTAAPLAQEMHRGSSRSGVLLKNELVGTVTPMQALRRKWLRRCRDHHSRYQAFRCPLTDVVAG
jgi:hypothetical protein